VHRRLNIYTTAAVRSECFPDSEWGHILKFNN
jgi:hypothetical protein